MIVPTPLDWIANDGNFATAAMLEAGVGDPLSFLLDPPGAQVRRTTAQSIPNVTPTVIAFDSEDFDNDTIHSTVTNTSRLTIVTAGRYLISGIIPYDLNGTGYREARVTKNTVSFINGLRAMIPASGAVATVVALPALETPLIAGDFLELSAVQSSGGSLSTSATNGVFPVLRARWIGP
jgi:hypothetical protein